MSDGERKVSAATWLMNHVVRGTIKVFESDDGEPYAILPIGETKQVWHLESEEVKSHLSRKYYALRETVPGGQALRDCIQTLKGEAMHGMKRQRVWLRTAEKDSDLFLDLANDGWEAVRVHNGVWDVIRNPPVYFRRTKGMLPLPTPARDGNFELARRYWNVGDDDDWRLLRAWVIGAWRAGGPFPILILSGQQGSAKSTTMEFCRSVIDPNKAMLRQKAKSRHDFIVAANNSWVVAYDNLSYLDEEMSDCLCCIATGTGFTTRALFTDSKEIIIQVCCPICTTSIEDIATRGDLLDRSLLIHCPVLTPEKRRSLRALRSAYEQDLPLIFGGGLDILAAAQKRYRYVRETGLPRMADWARFGIAIEQALKEPEGSFLSAYERNLKIGKVTALESSPLVPALQELVKKWPHWEGNASSLLAELRDVCIGVPNPKDWPRLPNQLSNRLKRLMPHLPAAGIDASLRTIDGHKLWTISARKGESTDTTDTPFENKQGDILA